MSHYSSSARTPPGLILGGVVLLGVTAALSLPFPLLGGILLTPALLAAAVTGYLNRPSSHIIAVAASMAALLIALLSIILIFAQPSGDLVVLSVLHTFYGFFCAICALIGTTKLRLGRKQHMKADNGTPPPDLRTDLTRVGAAAVQGDRHAVAAWETYQRLSEPRRRRAAARAERRERRREEYRERLRLLEAEKRARESDEIHKAQLRQAREYNSRFWF